MGGGGAKCFHPLNTGNLREKNCLGTLLILKIKDIAIFHISGFFSSYKPNVYIYIYIKLISHLKTLQITEIGTIDVFSDRENTRNMNFHVPCVI